jgi:5-methylcytosine-specific restriction endonuclease McrA
MKFDCGCTIPIIDGVPQIDFRNLNERCPKAWELLATGKTKGIFQLENRHLGGKYAKAMMPADIEEIAQLSALIRPGTLDVKMKDGESATQHFIMRKNGEEEPEYLDESLRPILEPTQGIIVFQETAMAIAKEIGGFSLAEAETLRKAMGKKKAEVMEAITEQFVTGCVDHGKLDKEVAESIFDDVRKAERYSFNKCVSGDTIIRRYNTVRIPNKLGYTVEHMYRLKNELEYAKQCGQEQLRRKFNRQGHYGEAMSLCDDGRVRPNIIENIQLADEQKVYKITLNNNATIKVTMSHKFPTPNGEKELSELSMGDLLYVVGEYEKTTTKYGWSNTTKEDMKRKKSTHDGTTVGFMAGEDNPGYTDGEYIKYIINSKKLPKSCQLCGKKHRRLEVHHKDLNRQNNDLSNLQRLCPSCHKKAHYKNGRTKRGEKGYPALLAEIVKIEYIGIESTYDVTMSGPNHNFVTGTNIVTSNSHAVGYGKISYQTLYAKAHFPIEFYASTLQETKGKIKGKQELAEIIRELRTFEFKINPPSLLHLCETFDIFDDELYFGLSDVHGVGSSDYSNFINKVQDAESTFIPRADWTSIDFITMVDASSTAMNNTIRAGLLNHLDIPRKRLLSDYAIWRRLTIGERTRLRKRRWDSIESILLFLISEYSQKNGERAKTRVDKLNSELHLFHNPPKFLEDTKQDINKYEIDMLGYPITYSNIASRDFIPSVNSISILGLMKAPKGEYTINCTVLSTKEYEIKRGKHVGRKLGNIVVEDDEHDIRLTAFSDEWEAQQHTLFEGNTVELFVNKNEKGIYINGVKQI